MCYNADVREDYYELLDVSPSADRQTLRAAYHRLAMRYHPDHSGDDPAAEERFKLIAEAWRTLSDDEKRAEYDVWLERHRRYVSMPELAAMPQRHARMSSRQGVERRRERASRRESRGTRRPRLFLLRRVPKVGYWRYVLMCICALLAMQPFIRAYSGVRSSREATSSFVPNSGLPPGESPLPPEERRKQLSIYVRRLAEAAQSGDAHAQYRYGYILFKGIEDVIAPNHVESLHWWRLAAAQGNTSALYMLNKHQTEAASHQEIAPVSAASPAQQ